MGDINWDTIDDIEKTCSLYQEEDKPLTGTTVTRLNVPKNIISYEKDNENNPMTCIQRCLFSYKYTTPSSCIISKTSYYVSVSYDGGGEVTYNKINFKPTKINIFKPSLHTYDGYQSSEGEIIIEHVSQGNSEFSGLLICIPLSSTSSSIASNASILIETIIDSVPSGSNESVTLIDNDETTETSVNLVNFTLNSIIPKAPYYNYKGPKPYDKCNSNKTYQYVVFNPLNQGSIAINPTSVRNLRNAISMSNIVAYDTTPESISFNSKGTTQNRLTTSPTGEVTTLTEMDDGDDQIYIQCQPTGESNDEKIFKEPKIPFAIDINSNNDDLNNILLTIAGIVAIFIAYMVFKYLTSFVSSYKVNTTLKIETG